MSVKGRIVLTPYIWSSSGGNEQNVTSLACALKRAGCDVVVLAWAYVADRPTAYEAQFRNAGVNFISTNSFLGRLAFRWEYKVQVINWLLHGLAWLYAPLVLAYALGRRCGWQSAARGVEGRLRKIGLAGLQGFTADRYLRAWLTWLHWLRPVSVLNQHLSGSPAAIQWARQHHVPIIYTEGNLPDEQQIGLWAGIQPELCYAQRVIAATPAVKQAMAAHLGIDARRITVIPNIVDFGARGIISTRYPVPANVAEILFVGRLDPMKGIDVLLAAAAMLKEQTAGWHISIIGEGYAADELHRQAERLRLGGHVTFCGNFNHDDLPERFEHAWVLVAPSRHLEGFGMVVAEALSFGLPVVASDLPAFRSLVEHGQNGMLVPPGDPQALAEALASLLRNPADHQRMRQIALARSDHSPFHPDVVARQFLDVYHQAQQEAAIQGPKH